ncbi:MAG: 4Fe-4S binding protein, partial [Spirochaetia bacterium]|nr:4Fe-4S binding protein [Spirochaetia bacterium]
MKIKSTAAAIITIVLILGGVFITKLTGNWITESTKVPRLITAGEFAGFSDPADIRGSYSFQDISDNFSLSAEDLAQAFALDTSVKNAGEYLAKDLEGIYGELLDGDGEVGTDSLRWFVALYLGYPYTPEETTLLPSPALAFLREKGLID